eukprot:gene14314-16926_t
MCLVLDVEQRVSQPDQISVQLEQPQNLALALARLDLGLEQNPLGKEADQPQEKQEFDEFQGNDAGILSIGEYDEDDREADDIWEKIDDHMDGRRRDRREARLKKEIEEYRASNPKITEQFADLKRKLSDVTEDEWDSIPDIGDYTIKNKKRNASFVPVPDTLLAKAAAEKEQVAAIDPKSKLVGGFETPMGLSTPMGNTPMTDLTAVGEGRGVVLELKLDRMADSVGGQTVVDPKGYLTDLKSMKINTDAEIGDIKRARLLLKSVIQSNPGHAPGWIAAARLEEFAGKVAAARTFIQQGCEKCTKSEDVWLEAVRLQTPENAKAVLARGVSEIPTSVKLWLQGGTERMWMKSAIVEREMGNDADELAVLRDGLAKYPLAWKMWLMLGQLHTRMGHAVQALEAYALGIRKCPNCTPLWAAAAMQEEANGNKSKARAMLEGGRLKNPKNADLWLCAVRAEQRNNNQKAAEALMAKALQECPTSGALWAEAVRLAPRPQRKSKSVDALRRCDNDPFVIAAVAQLFWNDRKAIVRTTIGIGVDDEDRKRTWMADAEDCLKRQSTETARAIFAHALSVFPGKKSVWLRAAQLEKAAGSRESLDALLRRAVTYCPQAEILWLMGAKEKWAAGDVSAARSILQEAFAANPDSEEVWLAAFKLEFENHEPERARLILAKAREK